MRLENKVALISGGARGMGAAEAKLFASEGAKVVIGDILEDEGRRTEAEINEAGGECVFVRLDVTSEADWVAAVETAVNRYGKLDILVGDSVSLSSPAKGLSEKESKQRMADWQKEVNELMTVLRDRKASAEERQEASTRYSKLYQEKNKFVKQESTGFVWLYLQK